MLHFFLSFRFNTRERADFEPAVDTRVCYNYDAGWKYRETENALVFSGSFISSLAFHDPGVYVTKIKRRKNFLFTSVR